MIAIPVVKPYRVRPRQHLAPWDLEQSSSSILDSIVREIRNGDALGSMRIRGPELSVP